jgi:ABC-type lipoprotein export system ATPase subunit
VLTIQNVSVAYGGARVLADVSLDISPGSTALMGPSGSGKSTLLRVIAGKQAPTAGTVKIGGEPVERASWRSSGDPRIAMVFQEYRLVSFLTVGDNIALAAEARKRPITDLEVAEALTRVRLPPAMASRAPASLSGGEQQRVAIARALVSGAPVLLADEPTGALDANNSQSVAELLKGLGEDGLTVVVATHDEAVAANLRHVVRLGDNGEVQLTKGAR